MQESKMAEHEKNNPKKERGGKNLLLWGATVVLVVLAAGTYVANTGAANRGAATPTITAVPVVSTEGASCGGPFGAKCGKGEICTFRKLSDIGGVCKKQCDDGDLADMQCVGVYSGVLTYYECAEGAWQSRSVPDFPVCTGVENSTKAE